jgi:CxxC motif-containing protein (DUF1111 family)
MPFCTPAPPCRPTGIPAPSRLRRFLSTIREQSALAVLFGLAVCSASAPALAQPSGGVAFTPLFTQTFTQAESQNHRVLADGTIVTFGSGRGRGRHEMEGEFYEFGPLYFQQRTFQFEIRDHVAAGRDYIEIIYEPEYAYYNPPQCRNAYATQRPDGSGAGEWRSDFNNNMSFDPQPISPARPDGTGQRWACFIRRNALTGSDGRLRVGDQLQVEFQTFIGLTETDPNFVGRRVYYTETFRFRLGQPGLMIADDPATHTRISSGGAATAPWVRATSAVQPNQVISTSGNMLTYWTGAVGTSPQATHRILDRPSSTAGGYQSHVVQSGIRDFTAFRREAHNLRWQTLRDFLNGRRLLHSSMVDGQHSEAGNGVLPELVNLARGLNVQNSCVACHVNNGRGPAPSAGAPVSTMAFEVSSGDLDASGRPQPHPLFGSMLQWRSLNSAVPAEPQAQVAYTVVNGTYADGSAYQLQAPSYSFVGGQSGGGGTRIFASSFEPNDGASSGIQFFSPRMPQNLAGLGLLEAIDEATLLERHDPNDSNGDGISGRASLLTQSGAPNPYIGRFGWKADQYSLRRFIANALRNDIGVKTSVFPQLDCTASQTACTQQAQSGGTLSDRALDLLTVYIQALGAPGRRPHTVDLPPVARGEAAFATLGCADCHTPTLRTGMKHPLAELRGQTIRPYSDLLLHDMGPDLADQLSSNGERNREWRTPPLWGMGMRQAVNGHSRLLHDGRARSLEEAILWHGGEAQASRNRFRTAAATVRQDLIAFLESL